MRYLITFVEFIESLLASTFYTIGSIAGILYILEKLPQYYYLLNL